MRWMESMWTCPTRGCAVTQTPCGSYFLQSVGGWCEHLLLSQWDLHSLCSRLTKGTCLPRFPLPWRTDKACLSKIWKQMLSWVPSWVASILAWITQTFNLAIQVLFVLCCAATYDLESRSSDQIQQVAWVEWISKMHHTILLIWMHFL